MKRSQRLALRRADAAATKIVNRKHKTKEQARRDACMMETLKTGPPPYTPDVMSWLSLQLGKKSSRITDTDVQTLLA